MPHRRMRKGEIQRGLFLGISESGKSCLAKARALRQVKEGYAVLVFSPTREPWPCRWQTADPEELLRAFWNNRGCVFYLDEFATDFQGAGSEAKDRSRVSTRGRHLLHEVNVITQHYRSLLPAVREQHTHLYVCTQGRSSAEALAEERADPVFLDAVTLPRGQFIHKPGNMAPAAVRTFDLAEHCRRFPEFRRYA